MALRVRANPNPPPRTRVIGHPEGIQPERGFAAQPGGAETAEPGMFPLAEAAQMRFEQLAMEEVADQMVRRAAGTAAGNEGAEMLSRRYGPRVEREILRRLHQAINMPSVALTEE